MVSLLSGKKSVDGGKEGAGGTNKEREKLAKEREKERAELAELVGSTRSALVVETLTGYRILMISESDPVVNEWVYAINSIITQIVSSLWCDVGGGQI